MCSYRYYVRQTGKLYKRIRLFADFEILFVRAPAQAGLFVLHTFIGLAKFTLHAQGVMPLLVGTFPVLRPLACRHTAIAAGVYLAMGFYLHKKGIAAKFEVVKRIGEQFFLCGNRVLQPFPLYPALPGCLLVGIKAAGGGESRKQKAQSH